MAPKEGAAEMADPFSPVRGKRFAWASATGRLIAVSLLWFALSTQWTTVVPVIVPEQVSIIVGPHSADKEGFTGTTLAAGAVLAVLIAPLAGALSDRSRNPKGRRRNFLIAGTIGSSLGLLLLAPFGWGSSLVLYGIAFLHVTFWWNWLAGAYAGLVPDVVPPPRQALASAWLNIMSVVGIGVGNLLVAIIYVPTHPIGVFVAFVAINTVSLWLLLRHVDEPRPAAPSAGAALTLATFLRGFYIDPKAHPNFYWVTVTRFLVNLGIWSISAFLLFYLHDVIGAARPANVLATLTAIGSALSIPASILAARFAQSHGLTITVQTTTCIMAAASLCYILIPLRPSFAAFAAVMLLFSVGWGAYQAVDWALALRVLPNLEDAGKDMGIWHIALVLPLIIGPLITGWLVSLLKESVSVGASYMAAFAIPTVWFALAAVLVRRVRLAQGP